jgi:flavin reductase (DIM6/NTAB) family NADH-FMN oxidoreductase RutF
MKDLVSALPGWKILGDTVTINSSLKEAGRPSLEALADAIAADIPKTVIPTHEKNAVDIPAFFKLSYGLFLLSTKDGDKDNGCIINTAVQVTDTPKRVSIAVNKKNFTHDLILKTGIFTVSTLTIDTPFKFFQHFGFQSGRDVDKFADAQEKKRGANGLIYGSLFSNAFISGKVMAATDYGSHTLFVADVTEAGLLSDVPSLTYQYYFDNVKPKPPLTTEKKQGYVCKICGYIHEGPDLPADFVCPLCKHGAADFEKLA